MDRLLEKCIFKKEFASAFSGANAAAEYINMEDVHDFVQRGRAALLPIEGSNDVSVSVKDGSQSDVVNLPCGARSLIIDPNSGRVVVRGVNKFPDFADVPQECFQTDLFWSTCDVWAQRKLAGFVVTIFTMDGVSLKLMTKHAMEGEHVTWARHVLNERLSSQQQQVVAKDLRILGAVVSCECIVPSSDFGHPVMEAKSFENQLVAFSIHRQHSVRELCLRHTEMTALCHEWGLPCTESTGVPDQLALKNLQAAVRSWTACVKPFGQLAEGLVIVVRAPQLTADEQWFTPIRLKLKTVQYIVLRSFRSLVLGESSPRPLLYHRAMLLWANITNVNVKDVIMREGVHRVHDRFVAYVDSVKHVRYREASQNVSSAFAKLRSFTTAEVFAASGKVLLVMLCGLPGTGKSTLAEAVLREYERKGSPFESVVYISKDAVTQQVATEHSINSTSSKHKKRSLRALTHKKLLDVFDNVNAFVCTRATPVMVLFDACNATRATRESWFHLLMTDKKECLLVYMEAAVGDVHARLSSRGDHETIHSVEEAQQALYVVKKKFVAPLPEERALYLNSSASPLKEMVQCVEKEVNARFPQERGKACHTERLDPNTMVEALEGYTQNLLFDVFGVRKDPAAHLALQRRPSRNETKETVYAVRLDTSIESLRCLVQQVVGFILLDRKEKKQASTANRVWSGLRSLFFSTAGIQPSDVAVEAGHTRWIRGWLLQRQGVSEGPDDVETAIWERFERSAQTPHVTLLYSKKGITSPSSFAAVTGLALGQSVTVQLTSLLMDRRAVCFGVMLNAVERQWSAEEETAKGPPLHLTIATSPRMTALYCGTMLTQFEQWQEENICLENQKKENAVTRSKHKFHNFVQVRLIKPVFLKGTVVLPNE